METRFRLSLAMGAAVILAALAATVYTDPSWFLVLACLGMALMGWGSVQKLQQPESSAATALDRAAAWGVTGAGALVGIGIAGLLIFGT